MPLPRPPARVSLSLRPLHPPGPATESCTPLGRGQVSCGGWGAAVGVSWESPVFLGGWDQGGYLGHGGGACGGVPLLCWGVTCREATLGNGGPPPAPTPCPFCRAQVGGGTLGPFPNTLISTNGRGVGTGGVEPSCPGAACLYSHPFPTATPVPSPRPQGPLPTPPVAPPIYLYTPCLCSNACRAREFGFVRSAPPRPARCREIYFSSHLRQTETDVDKVEAKTKQGKRPKAPQSAPPATPRLYRTSSQ